MLRSPVMAKDESPREASLRRGAEQQARVTRQQKMVAALKAMRSLFATTTGRDAEAHAEAWRPWRAYALLRLWNSLGVTP